MSFYEQKFKPPLHPSEQLKYLKWAQNGDKKALELLIEHNLGLIANIIYKNYSTYNDDVQTDLFSVGCLSLVKSIKNFKFENSNNFSTYATSCIIAEMKKFISTNNIIHIPRKIQELYKKIVLLQNNTKEKNISTNEIANILNISEYEVIEALLYKQSIDSLNEPKWKNSKNDSTTLLKETIPDNNISLYTIIEKKETYTKLLETIDLLNEIEKNIIKLVFGINTDKKTQKEIAKIYNMSQANISRILKKALYKLKILLPEYIRNEYNNQNQKKKV